MAVDAIVQTVLAQSTPPTKNNVVLDASKRAVQMMLRSMYRKRTAN